MSTVTAQIRIDAPVERVWETVMDPNRFSEWVTIHRAVKDVSDRPLTKGSTMEQVIHMRGVTFHVRWTLVEVNAPHTALWEGRGPAHSRARIRYEISRDGDGSSVFDYTNEFTTPGGRLGAAASRMIVGAASQREAHRSLERLKALLEHN
jgi:uncharacterized protein YndB with AHSA1/START domain